MITKCEKMSDEVRRIATRKKNNLKPIDRMTYLVSGGDFLQNEIEVNGKTLVWEPAVIVLE